VTLQTLILEGGNALSEFRIQQLLPRLQAICPFVVGLTGQHVHLVASESPLDDAAQRVMSQLLTYGEPANASAHAVSAWHLWVSPRLGTVSPWASKATDIAHNCGLAVRRIERLIEYKLTLNSADQVQSLSPSVKLQLADVLHLSLIHI
jgi:phosphoribosylformylglycinamidine synthase